MFLLFFKHFLCLIELIFSLFELLREPCVRPLLFDQKRGMVFLKFIVVFDYVSCVQPILEDLNVPIDNLKLFHLLVKLFLQIFPFVFLRLSHIILIIIMRGTLFLVSHSRLEISTSRKESTGLVLHCLILVDLWNEAIVEHERIFLLKCITGFKAGPLFGYVKLLLQQHAL